MRSAGVTVRRPGARMAPASNSGTCNTTIAVNGIPAPASPPARRSPRRRCHRVTGLNGLARRFRNSKRAGRPVSSSERALLFDRQRKNIANAALGPDHPRRIQINLQLAPQPQDPNINAAIEDIFMNSRRTQEMLARKRSLWRFQKRQQQGVLTFAQRDWFFGDDAPAEVLREPGSAWE
jgi:hypothetical protein